MAFIPVLALMLSLDSGSTVPCLQRDDIVFHAPPLCQYLTVDIESATGVTFEASLTPRPARQQIVVYRDDDTWFLDIDGYRWNRDDRLFETRRRIVQIRKEAALRLIALAPKEKIAALATRDYYGNRPDAVAHEVIICVDGSSLAIELVEGTEGTGQLTRAERHSCSDDQSIDAIASAFRRAALTADPEFDGFLSGLGR